MAYAGPRGIPAVPNTTPVPETPPVTTAPGTDLGNSKYDFRYKVFPNDLGSGDNGHYMVININVPVEGIAPKGVPGVSDNGLTLGTPAGAFTDRFTAINQVSKLDVLRYGQNTLGGAQRPAFSIPRNTRRIAESIALFMPTPLIFNGQNVYEDVSLTALGGKLTVGAANFVSAGLRSWLGKGVGKITDGLINLGEGIAQAGGAAAAVMQNPINPMVEILFTNTAQRQFTFELLLAPRNEKESEAIKNIIATLRFHAAPEINSKTYGTTWIPPADFDITFFNKGVENTNLLRINTCVLERCEVDYAPTAGIYSTFRNGHPVAVRVSLGFRELEPVHKLRILQGF